MARSYGWVLDTDYRTLLNLYLCVNMVRDYVKYVQCLNVNDDKGFHGHTYSESAIQVRGSGNEARCWIRPVISYPGGLH